MAGTKYPQGSQNDAFFDLLQSTNSAGGHPSSGQQTATVKPSLVDVSFESTDESFDFQPLRHSAANKAVVSDISSGWPGNSSTMGSKPQAAPPSYQLPQEALHGEYQKEASEGAATIAAVERTMKKYADNLLRVLEDMSGRLQHLEVATARLETKVAEIQQAAGDNSGRLDGRIRSLENTLREVQRGVQVIRDKQEIAEAQAELAKMAATSAPPAPSPAPTSAPGDAVSAVPTSSSPASSFTSTPPQPIPAVSTAQAMPAIVGSNVSSDAPSAGPYTQPQQTTTQQQARYQPQAPPPPPPPQQQPPPQQSPPPQQQQQPLPPQLQYTQPQQQQQQPPLQQQGAMTFSQDGMPLPNPYPQVQYSEAPPYQSAPPQGAGSQPPPYGSPQPVHYAHQQQQQPQHPQQQQQQQLPPQMDLPAPYLPPGYGHQHKAFGGSPRSFGGQQQQPPPPPAQPPAYDMGGAPSRIPGQLALPAPFMPSQQQQQQQQLYDAPPGGGQQGMYGSGPPSGGLYRVAQPAPSAPSSTGGGGGGYPRLQLAQPVHSSPLNQSSSGGSSGGGSGGGGGGGAPLSTSRVPIDKVIDDVAAMGFTRDQVRAVVKKLTENGQSVDLNVVLDKLMNPDGPSGGPPKGWFGR